MHDPVSSISSTVEMNKTDRGRDLTDLGEGTRSSKWSVEIPGSPGILRLFPLAVSAGA